MKLTDIGTQTHWPGLDAGTFREGTGRSLLVLRRCNWAGWFRRSCTAAKDAGNPFGLDGIGEGGDVFSFGAAAQDPVSAAILLPGTRQPESSSCDTVLQELLVAHSKDGKSSADSFLLTQWGKEDEITMKL